MCCGSSSARQCWGCRCSKRQSDPCFYLRFPIPWSTRASARKKAMNRTIWVGAVAYDPKVVTIWEGMRRYFHEEVHLSVEVVLFQSYEMQVAALLAGPNDPIPRIAIGWKTHLAYLQADAWSNARCRPIAMRDTDLGWM